MELQKVDRDRVRSLSVIMGAAFQRSALRLSNYLIFAFSAFAVLALPDLLTAPVVLVGLLLLVANTFLGASDEDLLAELLFDLGEEHARTLGPAEGRSLLSSELGKGEQKRRALRGKGRELFQSFAKLKKELEADLDFGGEALPGFDVSKAKARLQGLMISFRALAERRWHLEHILSQYSMDELEEEARALEEKAAASSSEKAVRDYESAASQKRAHRDSLSRVLQGIEKIDAKLHHILSTLEGYRAKLASMTVHEQERGESSDEEVEALLGGLSEEAEDLSRSLEEIE